MTFATLAWIAAGLTATPLAAATTTTVAESFDGPLERATWRFGIDDAIDADGGSPGAFLHNPTFDAAVPSPVYVGPQPSPFFGDYRAARVVSLGLDINIYSVTFAVNHLRAPALVLASDMGTPEDPSDDCEVSFVSRKPLPSPGSGWRAYDYRVPADSATLPAGWAVNGSCAGLSPDAAWNRVITNVTKVRFPFAPPGTLWFFQVWDLGIDSVRISFAADP